MSAMIAPQPYTQRHASASRNLLNLDCSADLRSYRRDLGPGVQAKCFEKTSDTIRAQLDDHRAFLLQHRRSGQASGLPSPVPRIDLPQPQAVPGNTVATPQLNAQTNGYHTTSQPRPLHYLSQPHAPQQTTASAPQPTAAPAPLQTAAPDRPRSSVRGRVDTFPSGLRQALERCNQYGQRHRESMVYEAIRHIQEYTCGMPDTKDVVGTYDGLQEANLKVADEFLFGGYYVSALDEPVYEVTSEGMLSCAVWTDGSVGGYTTIYVKSKRPRRNRGSRRSR